MVHGSPFFSPINYIRGLKQWLIDVVRDLSFAGRLIEFAIEPHMEIAKAFIEEAKVDCIWIFGDQGTPKGPFLSPRQYREMVYPWDRSPCKSYHKRGAFVFIHSHGYLMPIMDDLLKAGFDAIHPISPLCRMNLAEMKEKCGDKVTLFAELSVEMDPQGEIDTERYGSIQYGFKYIEDKVKALEHTIKTTAPGGGGFIFAPTVQPVRKPDTLSKETAYLKAWDRLRRYPTFS